jgi:hypothetical protein
MKGEGEGKAETPQSEINIQQLSGGQIGDRNTQNNRYHYIINNIFSAGSSRVSRRTTFIVLASVAILAVPLTIAGVKISTAPGSQTGKAAPNTVPMPASSTSPPVEVESVTNLKSITGDGSLALSNTLIMTKNQLQEFNTRDTMNSAAYEAWYRNIGASAIDFGVTGITLRGNYKTAVRIADMKVIKDCQAPLNGTYFQGYSQGEGDTVKIGFNLDAPDPIPQQLAITGNGLTPLGINYFDQEYISLAPGESITLTVGAFTKHYACHFRIQLMIATPDGTFTEDIDNHGEPFTVTARAAPNRQATPYSGYRAAYAYESRDGVPIGWAEVNPSTYKNP